MLPFSRQHSAPLGARLDLERDAKAFMQPSVSSSSLPAAPASPSFNRSSSRRARSILALALTLLALVFVAVAAWGPSRGPQPPSSRDEAGVLPRPSPLSSSVFPPPPARRRPLPSASAAVVAVALASAEDEDNKKSDAGFPLAVVRAPLLTQAELLTLQHYARGSVYAEWGSGASTVLAAPMARRAVSIENQVGEGEGERERERERERGGERKTSSFFSSFASVQEGQLRALQGARGGPEKPKGGGGEGEGEGEETCERARLPFFSFRGGS